MHAGSDGVDQLDQAAIAIDQALIRPAPHAFEQTIHIGRILAADFQASWEVIPVAGQHSCDQCCV